MISIIKATENDYSVIADIGKVSVAEAHRASCPAEVMDEFIETHYNAEAIKKELSDTNNIYHIIQYDGQPAGFSKIILNSGHSNIERENVTKLDRIYLLKEFQGLKLGIELLKFNIQLSKDNNQSGIWLFTWTGNSKAIDFYSRAGFKIIGSHDFYITKTHSNPNHHMLLGFSNDGHEEKSL